MTKKPSCSPGVNVGNLDEVGNGADVVRAGVALRPKDGRHALRHQAAGLLLGLKAGKEREGIQIIANEVDPTSEDSLPS